MTETWRLSASELSALIRRRALSATEATQATLARLAAVNPRINAVVQEMPDQALAAAAAVDAAELLPAEGAPPPLPPVAPPRMICPRISSSAS